MSKDKFGTKAKRASAKGNAKRLTKPGSASPSTNRGGPNRTRFSPC